MNKISIVPPIIALDFTKPGDEVTTCDFTAAGLAQWWVRRNE
jgi:hypothetical protein